MAPVYVGTSGWSYRHWREGFYAGLNQQEWLTHCATHFTALEVNATFYRRQSRATFERWAKSTPAGFRFAIKANRYLTHTRRLHQPESAVARERERASALGEKLGAVLWQLPAQMAPDTARLAPFLAALEQWPETRHAIEFRNPQWFAPAIAERLSAHHVAVCLSDAADWPLWEMITTDLVYLRLHGHHRTYASAYSDAALDRWAARIRAWLGEGRTVHTYFNNDAQGHAPYDAMRLLQRLPG